MERAAASGEEGEARCRAESDGGGKVVARAGNAGGERGGREGERREEGGEAAAKEMTEEGTGEKWTCCLFSGVLRPEEDEQEEAEVEEGQEGAERG